MTEGLRDWGSPVSFATNGGQYSIFANKPAKVLHCPQVFGPEPRKPWDGVALSLSFLQKMLNCPIFPKNAGLPQSLGLRSPRGLTGSKGFSCLLGRYSIFAVWDWFSWDSTALVLVVLQTCFAVPEFSWLGTTLWDLLLYGPKFSEYCFKRS